MYFFTDSPEALVSIALQDVCPGSFWFNIYLHITYLGQIIYFGAGSYFCELDQYHRHIYLFADKVADI